MRSTDQDIFTEFKGRFTENYVQQQLRSSGFDPICYWSSGNCAEVDFLIHDEDMIIRLKVKPGLNNNAKSLKLYRKLHNPVLTIRTSHLNLRLDDGLLNIPLYLMKELPRFLKQARRNLHG